MPTYIHAKPGVAGVESWMKIKDANNDGGYTLNSLMTVGGIVDLTVNMAKDQVQFTQLDTTGKITITTTANNSVSGTIRAQKDNFYGDGTTDGIQDVGVVQSSISSTLIDFEIYTGDYSDGTEGEYISGQGYITDLAPTWSSDDSVQQSPFTIAVSGDMTVAATVQLT